jgi:hypothetical protein
MSLAARHLAHHAALAAAQAAGEEIVIEPIAAPTPLQIGINTLATRHLAEIAQQEQAGETAVLLSLGNEPDDPLYAELKEFLGQDLRTLSEMQSTEDRIEVKRHLIERYREWIEGALRAGKEGAAAQDEIIAITFIWFLDIQDWQMALQVGAHILSSGIQLERHKRTPACIIAEDIAEAALKDLECVDIGTLAAADYLTSSYDMPDQVRAKIKKAIGRKLAEQVANFDPEDPNMPAGGKASLIDAALQALRRALQLNEKAGVKKDIEHLERELKKLSPDT